MKSINIKINGLLLEITNQRPFIKYVNESIHDFISNIINRVLWNPIRDSITVKLKKEK